MHTNIFTVILEPGVKSKTEILSAIVQVYNSCLTLHDAARAASRLVARLSNQLQSVVVHAVEVVVRLQLPDDDEHLLCVQCNRRLVVCCAVQRSLIVSATLCGGGA